LTQVGMLVACPTIGLVVGLYAWGAAADRHGERTVLALGLGLTAVLLLLAASPVAHGMLALGLLLALAGAATGSVSSGSGRLVLGWFGARQRGLAMGIRQTSTPLGMGLAALSMPPLAAAYGVHGAVAALAAACGGVAVMTALLTADPPRTTPKDAAADRSGNPYRGSSVLPRIHAGGALLVVPQFTASAFALVLLVDVRDWSAVHAGQLLAGAQVLGALVRIAAGRWSDRVGSRLRPMRQLALFTAAVCAATALAVAYPSALTGAVLVTAVAITASTNGLSFTATAERAGPAWSGRALGVHNTGQNLTAAVVPPAMGALITAAGYWPGFAVAAVCACASALVIPVRATAAGPDPEPGPAARLRPQASPTGTGT
ncbi:MFS transporter, partial [Actinacidiphila oryziradicis]|uniref:MFS transporter n=1 Tax=Actinacidiphila oryziradicis TaxID=2571141 RepID=UPI0023F39976